MQNLMQTLRDADIGLLVTLAQVWRVADTRLNLDELVQVLNDVMRDPQRAETVWDALDDRQRGALQMLLASGRKMPLNQFEIAFGKIRKMGKGAIEREQPHRNPQSTAEALFYRGLIAESFEQSATGMRPIIYVPEELAAALPVHKTAYADLGEDLPEEDADAPLTSIDDGIIESRQMADTSIVDDLTTVLAYLRVNPALVEADDFAELEAGRLEPHLLTPAEGRLSFLLGVGISANLITIQEGRAHTNRAGLQSWLSAPRGQQLKTLADAWRTARLYQELWHVPGLHPEPDGLTYNAPAAREAALNLLKRWAPEDEWFALDEFITRVKRFERDFMRPGGDYDRWYIRNDDNEYLRGFESWDAVEGAWLEFLMIGPLHWLGLVDLAEDAIRPTVWGRAFLGRVAWPTPNIPEETIAYDEEEDVLLASRKVPTVDRFQLARFTSWLPSGDPYHYILDAGGIGRAGQQGITTAHIVSFLTRHLGEPLPPALAQRLDAWQGGPQADVSFERLLVMRTTTPDLLDRLYDDPNFRRYMGARLGPMAVVVRAEQADALKTALGDVGINVEIFS